MRLKHFLATTAVTLAAAAPLAAETFNWPFTVSATGSANAALLEIDQINDLGTFVGMDVSFQAGFDVDFGNATSTIEIDDGGTAYMFQQEPSDTEQGFEASFVQNGSPVLTEYSANSMVVEISDNVDVDGLFSPELPFGLVDPDLEFADLSSVDIISFSVESFGPENALETIFFGIYDQSVFEASLGAPVFDFDLLTAGPLSTSMQVSLLEYEEGGPAPNPDASLGFLYYQYQGLIATRAAAFEAPSGEPTLTFTAAPPVVPVPAALPMLLAGIGALGFAARRKARKAA